MERKHAESLHGRRSNSFANGALVESSSSDNRRNRHRVAFGLGILLFALSVGLAAALFLTIGTANAELLVVGVNAAF